MTRDDIRASSPQQWSLAGAILITAVLSACAGAPVGSTVPISGNQGDPSTEQAGRMATRITHGPILGELDGGGVQVWIRLDGEPAKEVALEVLDANGQALVQLLACEAADRRTPRTLVWSVRGLSPGSVHRYRIAGVGHLWYADPGARTLEVFELRDHRPRTCHGFKQMDTNPRSSVGESGLARSLGNAADSPVGLVV